MPRNNTKQFSFEGTQEWVGKHSIQLALFNGILVLLLLLRSAGYFQPYLPITVNMVVFIALVMSVLLFNLKSRGIFILSLFFWLFATLLRTLNLDIWAERTAIYTYESLLVGIVLFSIEILRRKNRKFLSKIKAKSK